MAPAKRIIKSFVGDDINIRVDVTVNGVPGIDLTGATIEAEWHTPTPITPMLDITGLSEAYFVVSLQSTDTGAQVPGKYELMARLTSPIANRITVLDCTIDLDVQPITVP